MVYDMEKLSRYIEQLKIEKAEAIQKYEELKRMSSELYEDAWWLHDWIQTYAINKIYTHQEKFDAINIRWEFHK